MSVSTYMAFERVIQVGRIIEKAYYLWKNINNELQCQITVHRLSISIFHAQSKHANSLFTKKGGVYLVYYAHTHTHTHSSGAYYQTLANNESKKESRQ